MSDNKPNFHGSDLEAVAAYYHIPMDSILSYSSNVNPLGISPRLRASILEHIDCVSTYPDRDYSELRSAISEYCGAPSDALLIGSGATELISMFIKGIHPKKSLLVNPTYSEYEREIHLNGGTMDSFDLCAAQDFKPDVPALCSALTPDYDLLILCNPNNPTGTVFTHAELIPLLTHCRQNQIMVLIDETYVEFVENIETVTAVPLTSSFENLFVMRGVSKFFAAPGLRLGYGITQNRKVLDYIRETQNPWSVHSIAAFCGGEMFGDTEYIKKTADFIASERSRLSALLSDCEGLYLYPVTTNFILLRIEKDGVTSADVFEAAIQKGMMIRDCASFPGLSDRHIRFCFRHPEENDRLVALLKELF